MNSNDILIANTDDLRSEMDYLEKTLLKGHRIDPNLYEEYDVKRGLRDSTGRGVLTGLTEVSDVCGFDVINGRKIPAEGGLYYQGINVKDLVNGLQGNDLDLRRQLSFYSLDVFQKKMNWNIS